MTEPTQVTPGVDPATAPAGTLVDPASGNPVDPATGQVLDPVTGAPTGTVVDPVTGAPTGTVVDPATAVAPTDPAATDQAAAEQQAAAQPAAVASPSTVPTGDEHAAAPANDPGQAPAVASPAAVAQPAATEEGYVSSRPLLMVGAAGDEVAELGWLLAGHGFENAISRGQAAAPPILDDELMRVVVSFQQDQGIDPWKADEGESPVLTPGHMGIVDARTWKALLGYSPKVMQAGQHDEGASA